MKNYLSIWYEKKCASFTCCYFSPHLTIFSVVTSFLTSTSLLNVYCALVHVSRSDMVSTGVLALGRTELHIVEPDVKVNREYYRETLLKRGLLRDMRDISKLFIFQHYQQDNAPSHRARETVVLLSVETSAFIPPSLWPPNSTDLNPVDYRVWSVCKKVYKRIKVSDMEEQCQRIQTGTNLINVLSTEQSRSDIRLRACVKAKGGYFEQVLYTDSGNVDL